MKGERHNQESANFEGESAVYAREQHEQHPLPCMNNMKLEKTYFPLRTFSLISSTVLSVDAVLC